MATFRLIRLYVWRSKAAILLTALTLFLLAMLSSVHSGPAWVLDCERSLLWFPIMMSRLLGREVAILPVRRRDIWRARWLLATVGLTFLTNAARVVASETLLWPSDRLTVLTVLTLVTVDFLEAGAAVGCLTFLLRTAPRARRQPALRALRWAATLALFAAPVWSHGVDIYVLDTRGAWTLPLVLMIAVGLALTIFGAHNPSFVVSPRQVELRSEQPASERPRPIRLDAAPRSAVQGALRLLRDEAVRASASTVLVLVTVAVVLRVLSGRPLAGPNGEPEWILVGALMLSSMSPFTRRLRTLRSLPISVDLLALVPTVALAVAWTAALVLYVAVYRGVVGTWPAASVAVHGLEMLAVTAVAKSASLPFNRQWTPMFVGVPVFVVAVAVTIPVAASTPWGVSLAICALLATVAADRFTLTRASRLYARPHLGVGFS